MSPVSSWHLFEHLAFRLTFSAGRSRLTSKKASAMAVPTMRSSVHLEGEGEEVEVIVAVQWYRAAVAMTVAAVVVMNGGGRVVAMMVLAVVVMNGGDRVVAMMVVVVANKARTAISSSVHAMGEEEELS